MPHVSFSAAEIKRYKTVLTETELRKARAFLVSAKNLPWLMYHINAILSNHQHKELCLSLLIYKVCGYLSLLWCSVRDSPPRVKGGSQGLCIMNLLTYHGRGNTNEAWVAVIPCLVVMPSTYVHAHSVLPKKWSLVFLNGLSFETTKFYKENKIQIVLWTPT